MDQLHGLAPILNFAAIFSKAMNTGPLEYGVLGSQREWSTGLWSIEVLDAARSSGLWSIEVLDAARSSGLWSIGSRPRCRSTGLSDQITLVPSAWARTALGPCHCPPEKAEKPRAGHGPRPALGGP